LSIALYWLLWAQGAKRSHDIGKSGWWQLIPFYNVYLLFPEGNPYTNKYGGNPKEEFNFNLDIMTDIEKIKRAINNKTVSEPFRASDFSFLIRSSSYLSKHAVGNGRYSEYFIRVARGLYRLK